MAPTISNINLSQLLPSTGNKQIQSNPMNLPDSIKIDTSSINFSAKKDPTALILQSAIEKINAQFAPHIGDGALKKAIESGQDMSPKATAERILSFATQIIGRAEADQVDLPIAEQRSRTRLFQNIQTGIENGFSQARGILEGMQALHGGTKDKVNDTYQIVQQGLIKLASLLNLTPTTSSQA